MISINPSEVIWTVINFFLLYFSLKHFLYTPVLRFVENRKAGIEEKLKVEEDAKTRVAENEERLQEEKAKARMEAKQLLEQADEELEKRHEAAVREARANAGKLLKDGEAELQERRKRTAGKLHEAAPAMAELLAKRLLSEE